MWQRWRWAIFLVLVLTLSLAVVACTPTASTPTPSVLLPTLPLPTLVPATATTVSSPTPIAVQRGDLLYHEDFNANTWGWREAEDGTLQIRDGLYHLDDTKSPYDWLTQSNPRLLPNTVLAPHLTEGYVMDIVVTLPPDLALYALGIEANLQTLTLAGREETVAHTFTLRSNNTWIYAGGGAVATAAVYRTGNLPSELELRDGKPHLLTLEVIPTTTTLQMTLLVDGITAITITDASAPVPELEPFFREVNGAVGISFGVTTDLISTVLSDTPLRLAAEFDSVEIYGVER